MISLLVKIINKNYPYAINPYASIFSFISVAMKMRLGYSERE